MLNKQNNYLIILNSFLFLIINLSDAHACNSPRNPEDTEDLTYVRREGNRCEGFLPQKKNGSTISLISFSSSIFNKYENNNYPSKLKINVPNIKTHSTIKLTREFDSSNYLLNDFLDNTITSSGFTFTFKTTVLKKGKIPISQLESTAKDPENNTYYPVILEKPSEEYNFILNIPRTTKFLVFQIRNEREEVVDKEPTNFYENNRFSFTWKGIYKGKKAPSGIYEIYIITDQSNIPLRIHFYHDPKWLGYNQAGNKS